ncbi:hypothetical protein WALSEDRAFT_61220 [Wallemia mellicola CBS 633.66]|uniref:Uncharacterized protein n=1 Tax=Wallemia mellicola (strain ATCC MYA-4683 / CBS 633.66) TaxID=671144 RepID=I4Y7W5_WALMC|nr:hypothetical protein WALSEDRAFT_61220 [Wallemia mellicola CBS 633.66]EIM20057.1 hypothetical protein WALSEDRAFT_61220 [Wallemia mellicola CBS 633.66]|eukprot:XP_006959986.1 hypothetical protein WALSEDRAFT_61220 [Wallemia mellicola CBS 633.66]
MLRSRPGIHHQRCSKHPREAHHVSARTLKDRLRRWRAQNDRQRFRMCTCVFAMYSSLTSLVVQSVPAAPGTEQRCKTASSMPCATCPRTPP